MIVSSDRRLLIKKLLIGLLLGICIGMVPGQIGINVIVWTARQIIRVAVYFDPSADDFSGMVTHPPRRKPKAPHRSPNHVSGETIRDVTNSPGTIPYPQDSLLTQP